MIIFVSLCLIVGLLLAVCGIIMCGNCHGWASCVVGLEMRIGMEVFLLVGLVGMGEVGLVGVLMVGILVGLSLGNWRLVVIFCYCWLFLYFSSF